MAGANQNRRVPRRRDAARKVDSGTREVALRQPGKPCRKWGASNNNHDHNPRGSPRIRMGQSREGTTKARERRQEEGRDPGAILRIPATHGKIAKLIAESSGQGHMRARPPHGTVRGPKRHPEEGSARPQLRVRSSAQRTSGKENRNRSSNDRMGEEMPRARTEHDPTNLKTKGIVKFGKQKPRFQWQSGPHGHRHARPQADTATGRARRTSHKGSGTATPAEIHGQRQQRRKHLQTEKRVRRSKWWRRHPSKAWIHMQ